MESLLNRITVEIDRKLDMLSYLKGVKVPGRNIRNPAYNRVFDETANVYMRSLQGGVALNR